MQFFFEFTGVELLDEDGTGRKLQRPVGIEIRGGDVFGEVRGEFSRFTLWQLPPAQAKP